jgi:metal-responsive CopG/Arc/MetJ family transcriptional regulator
VSKPIQYKGKGDWKIMVRMPEQLALEVQNFINRRGLTCSALVREALADYLDSKAKK